MAKNDDGCDGCNSYKSGCWYSHHNTKENPCPCTECIVKVMCEEDCNDFISFREKCDHPEK